MISEGVEEQAVGGVRTARQLKRRLASFLVVNSSRDHLSVWLTSIAAGTHGGKATRILDAGAGSGLYRHLFDNFSYESADFGKVEKAYDAELTYTCDLRAIPVEDARFDLVVCTQVLEHVPDPLAVLSELRRVTKPTGVIYASAPLFYEEHEVPYDYYRYTQYAWAHLASEAGLELRDIDWLEGYYGTLAYQLQYAAVNLPSHLLPLRGIFALLAGAFGRADRKRARTDLGMPKNYRVVLVPLQTLDHLPLAGVST